MLDAVIWGLVQGLTEFLPISSSGHLVLVPAFLREVGLEVGQPQLAVSAVLHLGTLMAVLAHYRRDLIRFVRFRSDPGARQVLWLLALGTVPALIGLPFRDTLDQFEENPQNVAVALFATALLVVIAWRLPPGNRRLEEGSWKDAVVVGLFQALALVPGISRSGSTITGGVTRGLDRIEAARYSFLLAVPAIAGGGLLSVFDLDELGVSLATMLVGLVVSAVSGYMAIAVLLRALVRVGFLPFAIYAVLVGVLGVVVF